MSAPPLEDLVYRSPNLTIGRFHASPQHPQFHDSGPVHHSVFVFPRTAVRLQHAGARPFLAGPNVVTYYNRGQEYRRFAIDARGDRCEWFAIEPERLARATGEYDRGRTAERPFAFRFAPSDSGAYLLQRMVVRHLLQESTPDRLLVEEAVARILARVLAVAYRRPPAGESVGGASAARARHVEAASLALGERLDENLSLDELAKRCGVSPFYLCRAFRAETGETLHRFRTRLRLRAALEAVTEEGEDLTEIGLRHGFSSHSHFTEAFRRELGVPPSRLRRERSTTLLRELGRRLEAPPSPT